MEPIKPLTKEEMEKKDKARGINVPKKAYPRPTKYGIKGWTGYPVRGA